MSETSRWPQQLPVQRVRVARPTNRFDAMVAFYGEVLGLPQMHRFDDHAGYSGVSGGFTRRTLSPRARYPPRWH